MPATPPTAAHPGLPALPAGPALPPAADTAPTPQALGQLLRVALPDKHRQTAQGWFGDTDFLLTRAHVDDDGDTYHDGLFLTVWGQWDFWIADARRPTHASLLQAAAARAGHWLRRESTPPVGFTQLCRPHRPGVDANAVPWQRFDVATHAGPPEAVAACLLAWQGLLDYWRKGVAQRRAHHPLRERLLACWPPERIEALALLPAFAPAKPGNPLAPGLGGWQTLAAVSTRAPTPSGLGRNAPASFAGAAVRLAWPRMPRAEAAAPDGSEDDDTLAIYQIEVQRDPLRPGETGVEVSYAQRLGDTREPLPLEAADHTERLLRLLDAAQAQLTAHCDPAADAPDAFGWIDAIADHPPHAPDEAVIPPVWLALSHTWQAASRAHAARERRGADASAHADADTDEAGNAPAASASASAPSPSPSPDPRALHAARVLRLAREISRRQGAAAAERFHRRFAFAPGTQADRARADGLRVGPVGWLPDGSVAARVGGDGGRWLRLDRSRLSCAPLPADEAPGPAHGPAARVEGLFVEGDAQGVLWGRDAAAGRVLWRHPVATTPVTAVMLSPDGRSVLVGTAGGDLVMLRKAGGGDPFGTGDSRYVEGWRGVFWEGEEGVIWW
ncbi:hypothetical protein [Acidovorax sp. FG27]|uniref:hypothetical protein n=1 Tax=Acidovorax sp. FG27 TaxID=3133652 RepID=UPI0030EABAAC